jgi:hypothetical protein
VQDVAGLHHLSWLAGDTTALGMLIAIGLCGSTLTSFPITCPAGQHHGVGAVLWF